MKIHVCYSQADRYAGEIVTTSLVRSFTSAQIVASGETPSGLGAAVWINPSEDASADVAKLISSGGKAVVFGRIGPRVAEVLRLACRGDLDLPAEWVDCRFDPSSHHDASPVAVRYDRSHAIARLSPLNERPLCRFDFADEWNNLGFGRITLDHGPWSLQSAIEIGDATPIAQLVSPAAQPLVYAALREDDRGAALWFNRPVGPVDSLEWRVVESFLGDYRWDELPSFPYVAEIPAGFSGAVCARLDCDEAVSASRPLWELYSAHGLPLSLALLTGQALDSSDLDFFRKVIAARGSVVSHSAHHYPNWGGNYERACTEAIESREWFAKHLSEATPVRYAVSPFHQNPSYAVSALADCGYEGFVGGIIANDPEYLLGRAGRVPFANRPIASLSTQCMLHGDCYRRYGNTIDVYRQSFDNHLATGNIFSFLDHPFSTRYQYGWDDEATRLDAHRRLIEHIGGHADIWWANLNDALDFLRRRDATLVEIGTGGTLSIDAGGGPEHPRPAIIWKGRQFVC